MNNLKLTYFAFPFIIGMLLFSCKAQEKKSDKTKINHRSKKYLIEQLNKNEFTFNTLSAKANIVYDNGKKTSFKTHVRIKKDSAIWMSITPILGIEMARVMITKDTVKFMNRVDKEYFIGNFDYINNLFDSDLDYQMFEALLIGNSLTFDGNEKKIKSSIDRKKDAYYISTEKKRKVRKEIKKDKGKLKRQTQAIWLNPDTYKINELLVSSPDSIKRSDKSLTGIYSNHKELNSQLFPYHLNFELLSKAPAKIEVTYNKVSTGKPITFSFKIPSKYVQIKQ
jgi:Domain of unknown function (DUF4292)